MRSRCTAGATPTTTAPAGCRAALVGGPLHVLLLDITGGAADELQTGVALMTGLGQSGGRAPYDLRPGGRNRRAQFGDTS
ncbi:MULTISPECIES: hypothetical protein [Streptomyces]|uniref:Uncharacterized protein n=1 Tax=Streptomyces pratensis (strain ATCC 33331 / IAF-45CD) TaxID=591167 RepID=A0A8D4BIL5_STRFA